MPETQDPKLTRRQLAAERAVARKTVENRQRRRRIALLGAIAVVLATVALLASLAFLGGDDDDDDQVVAQSTPVNPNDPLAPTLARYAAGECPRPADDAEVAEAETACGLGQTVADQGRAHITEGDRHDPYNSTPPTSGPHIGNQVAPWGVAAAPIPDEVQVHNLEHGGVMLQYNCDCPEAVALLQRFADPATGYPTKVIAAPYPGMDSEIALTAWDRIWTMPAAELTADRVRAFIDGYIDRSPEVIPSERQTLEAWRESDAPKP